MMIDFKTLQQAEKCLVEGKEQLILALGEQAHHTGDPDGRCQQQIGEAWAAIDAMRALVKTAQQMQQEEDRLKAALNAEVTPMGED